VKPVKQATNPIDLILGNKPKEPELPPEEKQMARMKRDQIREALRNGELEHTLVEVEVEETTPRGEIPGTDVNMNDVLGSILPKKMKLRKVEVSEARRILAAEEEQSMIDMDAVYSEAIRCAEQDGIVFLDEIDKIARKSSGHGPDVSREGVQRDILPTSKAPPSHEIRARQDGPYPLIAAGAFHVAQVSI
jgi:ATP-dependent HslUV protease ATP-binding subunit HslU